VTFDPYAATVSGGQVVAAGGRENDRQPQRTLAITADATTGRGAQVSPSPDVGASENQFYGVTSSGGNVFAAGWTADSQPNVQSHSTLVEMLSHGQWTVMPTPNPGGSGGTNGLGGISAAPDGQVWAVGSYTTATSSNQTLIERYVP
jgi:uncharacterized membrane protein